MQGPGHTASFLCEENLISALVSPNTLDRLDFFFLTSKAVRGAAYPIRRSVALSSSLLVTNLLSVAS